MPKAVVRIEAEARLANGPPRSPPTSPPAPRLTSTKTQKRRGSGSFLKFWSVSENSVLTPLPASSAIMGSVDARTEHTPVDA